MSEINFYLRKEAWGWLSNFERARQEVDGIVYKSNEHYYQSQKTSNIELREWIRNAPRPYYAMIAGRGLRPYETVPNWDEIKVDIMLKGLRAKFSQNRHLKKKLLETGDAILHEDSPTDLFWGKKGEDMLGKLLMQVRGELRAKRNVTELNI